MHVSERGSAEQAGEAVAVALLLRRRRRARHLEHVRRQVGAELRRAHPAALDSLSPPASVFSQLPEVWCSQRSELHELAVHRLSRLTERVGTSASRLSTYARGTVTPSAHMLIRILDTPELLER